MIARFAADVKNVGDPDCVGQDVGLLVGAASNDDAGRAVTGKELRQAIGLANRLLTPEKDFERDEVRQRLARSLTKTAGPTALSGAAGLVTYRLVLDAEGAAIIDTAVQALSAPVPTVDANGAALFDPRSAATPNPSATSGAAFGPGVDGDRSRVPDGADDPADGPAVGDRAQVVVMIGYDQLFGTAPGAGITITGDVLSPAVVRRMACDARIIPMVLAGTGQALDLGAGRRFFSPAQRLVIWRRDHHSSTIPAAWTNDHHARWHSRGGPTTITNGALLCQRHHTLVHDHDHDRDLTATITDTRVTWHR